jgi:hypothetical protein
MPTLLFAGEIVQRLVRLVVADQHFTKVGAQTGANVRVVLSVVPIHYAAGVNTLLHPFLGIPLPSTSLTMCLPAQGCSASVPPLGSSLFA